MEKLYLLARGLNARFPGGNEPYRMATRLAEECGEVAAEVNLWENSGIKRQKNGPPSKIKMAGELKNVLSCVMQLALHYQVEEELAQSIEASLEKLRAEGRIYRPDGDSLINPCR